MNASIRPLIIAATIGALIAFDAPCGAGVTININSTNGTINGATSGSINGVPVTFAGFVQSNTIARFLVHGDLVLFAGDALNGAGSRGISLMVADDVNIAPTATINCSATAGPPGSAGPGGGNGGAGGPGQSGGGGSVTWGTGGVPGVPGIGGTLCIGGGPGTPGLPGGAPGAPALPNPSFTSTSSAGTVGVNAPASAGAGRTFSVSFGAFGGSGGAGGAGGGGGPGGGVGGGNGTAGSGGIIGQPGGNGGSGVDGLGGFAAGNTGAGEIISGGGGGGGGTGATGGAGGGAGGGGGSGGGGGGGGSWCQVFPPIVHNGGPGGAGGAGGRGNSGGNGGSGGAGGTGGHGGGAIEIIALGSALLDGVASARGSDGYINFGSDGSAGLTGFGGLGGSSGSSGEGNAGDGAAGGAGRTGGNGGRGGDGGDGGRGGGGAAGTLKFVATAISGSGVLDLRGGNQGMVPIGGNGRLIFGSSAINAFAGEILGPASASVIDGPTEANPYIMTDPASATPFITNLLGSADIYGLTSLSADDFASILADAPADAIAALVRVDSGLPQHVSDYDDFDLLAVINLDAAALDDPMLGVGAPNQMTELRVRGVANNPSFGGGGPQLLSSLEADKVWITLVPEDAVEFTLHGRSLTTSAASLSDGAALYLIAPDLCPADIDNSGAVNVSDLLAVINTWGACGNPADCPADIAPAPAGDDQVNVSDLLAVINGWGPCGP